MYAFFGLITWATCLCLAPPSSPTSAPSKSKQVRGELTAAKILTRMAETYATCKTYRDKGEVSATLEIEQMKMKVSKPFKTAFVRPDRFRFEYSEQSLMSKGDRYIIWRKGRQVKTWWSIEPGVQKAESLGRALAGATGVSSGSAHTIPALLMGEEIGGRRLTDLTGARLIKEKVWKKKRCYRVVGKFAGDPMTLWIEKETFLVRRIEEKVSAEGVDSVETTTYEPVINEEVPAELLKFNLPKNITEK